MMDTIHFSLANNFDELTRLMSSAEDFLRSRQIPERTIYCVNLILEEVVTNVIKYAFKDEWAHEIQLMLSLQESEVTIRCEDDGCAFDPLSLPPPQLHDSIMDCTEGGLGIYLVRQTAHSMNYLRENGKNILTITIK
ncbi:ATP-binding protein [Desulfomonile tiedjei]|nr:ATP-binding protein [Desulfomonile tiedjei]